MNFLKRCIDDITNKYSDLQDISIVIPGKRPAVFIKKILQEKGYSGFLPDFFTIDELIIKISGIQEIKGIALWLFAYEVYRKKYPSEDFANFLKWFPTLLKDWDDMLKFTENDKEVLGYMLDEERIKNWGENLGDDENNARKRNLNFWRKMNDFLPELKSELQKQDLATSGMISEKAKQNIQEFVKNISGKFVFIGFNALTPVEENLIKTFLQWDKAETYFQADQYYIDDEKQEAGKFLRMMKNWKEFNDNREFRWVKNDFEIPKNIKVYEVPGNISQTKILPEILENATKLSETAVVLLDENLLPASLEALSSVGTLNITMGFPLKNLSFSNAVKQVFYLQKQLLKKDSSYYYNDVLSILEEMPKTENEESIVSRFIRKIEERNIVYISKNLLNELLSELSFYALLQKQNSQTLLQIFTEICAHLKFQNQEDDILYENISHFEKCFKIIQNQIEPYDFEIGIDILEVLIQQLINSETIDFQGEPLQGLQVMGLLETRLLNFKNLIMLSVNEGKLPLGNSQNTYLPFDVRSQFRLNTFIENDSIYAYHFYRLIQDSENVHLLFNALSSGVNTGEKSRFITQMEIESPHKIEHFVIENHSEPIEPKGITIPKTPKVLEKLEDWKKRVAVSHLTTYLYNPVDFYFSKILNTYESDEIEEELSSRNYGNLIHYTLQELYEKNKGKILSESDLENLIQQKDKAINNAIEKLKHQPEFYERGMNFIHKSIASKVVEEILNYDLELVKSGNVLEIVDLERNFEGIDFFLNDDKTDKVSLFGYIDRIDRLNGKLRIIDYKTGKTKSLKITMKEDNIPNFFRNNNYKQAMQLCMYQYVVQHLPEFSGDFAETGIWSFAEVNRGVVPLQFSEGNLDESLVSIKNLILEILNPEIPFSEELPDLQEETL